MVSPYCSLIGMNKIITQWLREHFALNYKLQEQILTNIMQLE